jgi:hypothetical protein
MTSSWPIVIAILGLVVAAFWYDASVASASAQPQPTPPSANTQVAPER